MSDYPLIDLREQLVRIDKTIAEHEKIRAETASMPVTIAKMIAEADKIRREYWWYPVVVLTSGLTAGAALLVAGAALMKLFG